MNAIKDPRRQLQGAVSKAQGKHFEERLDESFAFYKAHGGAMIEKTPEPMRPVQNLGNGRFVAFFEKQAQPDYKGIINGGRMVMFEAKFTRTDRIEQSRVSQGQMDYLDRHQALGARCYVLVGFASGAVYRLPWSVWRNMKKVFGRKYITEDDVELIQYLVPVAEGGNLLLLD